MNPIDHIIHALKAGRSENTDETGCVQEMNCTLSVMTTGISLTAHPLH